MRRAFLIVMMFFVASITYGQTTKPVAKPPVKKVAAVSVNEELIKLVSAGMSEEILLATVAKTDKSKYNTSADALLKLKEAGISQKVIGAILGISSDSEKAQPALVASEESVPKNVAAQGEVSIPDGTEIRLKLIETVSSATARVDERVRFEAAEDVLVNNKVVIPLGAQAWGVITESEQKKSFGRAGKLNFTIDYVKAVDGQNIRLRTTKQRQGEESFVKAGVITYLAGPFGLMVKGKDVEVRAGAEYTIFIDGERRINLKATPPK